MNLSRKQIGDLGESIAEKFLVKRGHKIIQRNYWQKCGEIDIISQKKGTLRFVEVKTVSRENLKREESDSFRPEDNLHPWKFQRMTRAIQIYLIERDTQTPWQIDVVTVRLNVRSKKAKVDYIENIIL